MDIVIRVSSAAGRSRIVAKDNDTLDSLKEQVAQHLKVPKNEILLCFDPQGNKCIAGDNRRLSSLKVKSGCELHLICKTAPSVEGIDLTPPKHLTTADLPPLPATPSPQGGAASAAVAPHVPGSASASASGSHPPNGPSKSPIENVAGASSSSSSSSPAPKKNEKEAVTSTKHGDDNNKKVTFLSFDSFLKKRNYLTSDLPGSMSYAPSTLEMGRMNKLPPSVTLKHQAYRHVDHLEFMNVSEASEFVRYWKSDLAMVTPRVGWMYGYYREDPHYELGYRAVMEGIYEPPQVCKEGQFCLLEDPFLKTVDEVTAKLGFERIGIIFTTLPRESSLTSLEALQMAKHQLTFSSSKHYTGYPFVNKFVTCIITPCAEAGGEPVPTAFMVSDMGMAFVRDGILDGAPPEMTHMTVKEPQKGQLFPQILESGKPAQRFDVDWFVVKVNNSAPKKVRSRFRFARFPRENRRTPIEISAIRTYIKDVKKKVASNWEMYADFHFLLHIAKVLDPQTAFAVCSNIDSETKVDSALEELLLSLGG